MKSELRKAVKLAGALVLALIVGGAAIPAMADHRDWDDHGWGHRDGPPGHHKHFRYYRRHAPVVVYRDYWYEPYYVEPYVAPRVYVPRRIYPSADLNFNLNVPLF
jgi:hypothetical protein